jgi:very-short-patch-repair endonuclease
MGTTKLQQPAGVWELARTQHGVVSRAQLLARGMSTGAIRHRLKSGRLHPLMPGVYVVGRREVTTRGRWLAAVLACGPEARLSHRSAGALWGLRKEGREPVEVVVPGRVARKRPGVNVHRQAGLEVRPARIVDGIPVTDPISTLVDLATCLSAEQLENAVKEADHRDLVDPERLLAALGSIPHRRGTRRLRALLASPTFALMDSGLERRFFRLVHAGGLPLPETQVWLSGYRVDFFWPELGLVVEVDSLRYHRSALHQASDQRRDQTHLSSGLTPLRFAEHQVVHDPQHVQQTLATVIGRLRTRT